MVVSLEFAVDVWDAFVRVLRKHEVALND